MPAQTEDARAPTSETWKDWIPPGYSMPADEELITRDELLERVTASGVEISDRTLRLMEQRGITPRPVRQWHESAVRALYAPWVVDLVIRAYEWRRGHRSLDEARADVRDYVKPAILYANMDAWGGEGIPMEFVAQLIALAKRQEAVTGHPVPRAEVRFFNEDDRPVATLRYDLATGETMLNAINWQK